MYDNALAPHIQGLTTGESEMHTDCIKGWHENEGDDVCVRCGLDLNPPRIEIAPTFREATAICIAVLEIGATPEATDRAKAELMRYAAELDRLAELKATGIDA